MFSDTSRKKHTATFLTLRQQSKKSDGKPYLVLSDFVAPKESGVADYIGGFCVTAGFGTDALAKQFEAALDDYNSIMIKALADRLAEAFAEYLHQKVRTEYWGYVPSEELDNTDLIKERYRGIRPAPGYPACPDHVEKKTLWKLLDVEKHIGVTPYGELSYVARRIGFGLLFCASRGTVFRAWKNFKRSGGGIRPTP